MYSNVLNGAIKPYTLLLSSLSSLSLLTEHVLAAGQGAAVATFALADEALVHVLCVVAPVVAGHLRDLVLTETERDRERQTERQRETRGIEAERQRETETGRQRQRQRETTESYRRAPARLGSGQNRTPCCTCSDPPCRTLERAPAP